MTLVITRKATSPATVKSCSNTFARDVQRRVHRAFALEAFFQFSAVERRVIERCR